MPDDLPSRRIDRPALERIIQRAAELQAGELDSGDGVTEQELLKLGAEVGIDGRYLRQALYEEAAGGAATSERGVLAKWIGPGRAAASRVVPGDRTAVVQALELWMTENEALAVKRRLPDATVWERQRGFFAEMKRGFGVGGRSYELAKAKDVTVTLTQLEPGYCHVEMAADLSDARNHVGTAGGAAAGAMGLIGVAMLAVQGPPLAIALLAAVPIGSAILAPVLAARSYRSRYARTQLALEQILDRLEHGEVRPRHQSEDAGSLLLGRVVAEVRNAITEVAGASHRPSQRLPPGR